VARLRDKVEKMTVNAKRKRLEAAGCKALWGILDGWRGDCGARQRHQRNPIVALCCFAGVG